MSAVRQWLDRRQSESKPATYGPIGAYFTQDHLHLVQLERLDGDRIGIRSHESLSYPGSREDLMASPVVVCKLIRRGMQSGRFRGRKVVSAMPPEQVRVMSVSYPSSAEGNAGRNIAKSMAGRIDGNLTDYVIDYVPIRLSSRDGDSLALVAISRLEHVNNYLDFLTSAGLHVDYLEIEALAIKRLVSCRSTVNKNDHVIVVNVGQNATHLTTISGSRLLADQAIHFGADQILSAVADPLELETDVARNLVLSNSLDPARLNAEPVGSESNSDIDIAATLIQILKPEFLKLVRELDRAFLYADSESRSDGQKQVIIIGIMAQWPGATALLESLVKMPVESLGRDYMPFPTDSNSLESLSDQQAAEMSTAVGLALRGMSLHE